MSASEGDANGASSESSPEKIKNVSPPRSMLCSIFLAVLKTIQEEQDTKDNEDGIPYIKVLREMKQVYKLEDCKRVDTKVKTAAEESLKSGIISKTGGSKISSGSFRLGYKYFPEVERERPRVPRQQAAEAVQVNCDPTALIAANGDNNHTDTDEDVVTLESSSDDGEIRIEGRPTGARDATTPDLVMSSGDEDDKSEDEVKSRSASPEVVEVLSSFNEASSSSDGEASEDLDSDCKYSTDFLRSRKLRVVLTMLDESELPEEHQMADTLGRWAALELAQANKRSKKVQYIQGQKVRVEPVKKESAEPRVYKDWAAVLPERCNELGPRSSRSIRPVRYNLDMLSSDEDMKEQLREQKEEERKSRRKKKKKKEKRKKEGRTSKRKRSSDSDMDSDEPLSKRKSKRVKKSSSDEEEDEDMPLRGRMNSKVKKVKSSSSDEEDEDDDKPLRGGRRGSTRNSKVKKEKKASDDEYEADAKTSSDDGDEFDAGSDSSEPNTDSDEYSTDSDDPWSPKKSKSKGGGANALTQNIKLINTIDVSEERNWVKKYAVERKGVLTAKEKNFQHWPMFVMFLRKEDKGSGQSISKDFNPFKCSSEDVIKFLRHLRDAARPKIEISAARKCVLNLVDLPEDEKETLRKASLPKRSFRSKDKKEFKKAQKSYGILWTFTINVQVDHWIMYSQRGPAKPVNPFDCDPAIMAQFHRETYLGRGFTVASSVFTNCVDRFHSYRFKSGNKLHDAEPFLPIRRVELCLTNDLLTVPGVTKEEEENILSLTPDYKYAKYVSTNEGESKTFWKESFVFGIIEEIFNSDEAFQKTITISEASSVLGVTNEMILTNFTDLVIPKQNTMLEFMDSPLGHNPELFWSEFHVTEAVENAKYQEITLAAGAFELGVALAEFTAKVGQLQEKKKIEKKKAPTKPKKSFLEKQADADDAFESDYEKLRLKNIQDRLAMFKSLNFGTSKETFGLGKKNNKEKAVVEKREKSRRIQDKTTKAEDEGEANHDIRVPPLNGLPLLEFTAMNIQKEDPALSRKFLSCVHQELSAENEDVKMEETSSSGAFNKLGHMKVSQDKLTSCSISPESTDLFTLAACGDVRGGVGLVYHQEGGEEHGRTCAFRPHIATVHQVEFVNSDSNKIYSCSEDGFIRSTDLMSLKVDMAYQWNRFYLDPVTSGINYFTQRPGGSREIIMLREDGQVCLFDPRSQDLQFVAEGISSIGKSSEFLSASADGNLISCLTGNSVSFFDLRQIGKEDTEGTTAHIMSNNMTDMFSIGPILADFSPSGGKQQQLLVADRSGFHTVYTDALTKEVSKETIRGSINSLPVGKMGWSLDSGKRVCWNPFAADSLLSMSTIKTKAIQTSVLASLSAKDGSVLSVIDDDPMLGDSFGIVAEKKGAAMAAINAYGDGYVALYRMAK